MQVEKAWMSCSALTLDFYVVYKNKHISSKELFGTYKRKLSDLDEKEIISC